jgi:tRNA-Thr(GGU) m(6)t(6)A37 methyltransferase TsaA
MESEIRVRPIGHVESRVKRQTDEAWGEVVSRVAVRPEYRAGLAGLGQFSHVLVLTWLHEADFAAEKHLVRRPRGLDSMPAVGIFAQRAKDRPNPIGVTAVALVSVAADGIEVRGLDAIDGTPVLDLKPYYPVYDRVVDADVPEWVERLMAGYF